MFRGHRRKARVLFSATDIFLLALAFRLAYWLRTRLALQHNFYLEPTRIALLLGWSMLVWVALGYWWEIYDRIDAALPRVILRDAFRQCLLGSALVVLFQYLFRLTAAETAADARSFLGLFAGFTWVLLCLVRLNAGRLLGAFRGRFGVAHYVMVVGLGEPARRLGRELEDAASYGIRLTGFMADYARPARLRRNRAHLRLSRLSSRRTPRNCCAATSSTKSSSPSTARRLEDLEDVMLACDEEGVRTRVAVDFFPHVNSQVYLDRLGSSPLLTFSATPHDEIRLLVKRVTDIVLAAAWLVLLFPFMLLIALIIRLTSPGPSSSARSVADLTAAASCSTNSAPCARTPKPCEPRSSTSAPASSPSKSPMIRASPASAAGCANSRSMSCRSSGTSSRATCRLVGPRPALPEEVEQYQRWQRRRLRMRPGLTCLWAVNGRDNVDFETWMKLDMQYIDNWSLALDWKIILKTIPQLLSGKGAT